MFESLWIDKPDAPERIEALSKDTTTAEVAALLAHYHEFGYCIIEKAVPAEVIDQYRDELAALLAGDQLKISLGHDIKAAKGADIMVPLTKILDVHVHSEAARNISFSAPMRGFLQHLFGEPALAFQTLHFETGSTQAVHNDTAYVVLNEPKSLTASWVALEDIEEGSGELVYYPKSHRFGEFLYQNHRKNWCADEDGHEIHDHHLFWLHAKARQTGSKLESFRPKKGDVLFWHADLAHGGGEIKRQGSTRRSLVTHYCPARCTPHYFRFIDVERQIKRKIEAGGYISSFYYSLER